MRKTSVLVLACISLIGCAGPTVQYDSTKRAPTTQVDVFREGQKPSSAYKEIALLTDEGGLIEQGDIEGKMIKKAKGMGANAIIFQPLVKSGGELKGFSWVENYVYKGSLLVYTENK